MREILFRGKLTNKRGWAYGNLSIKPNNQCAIITPDDTVIGKYGKVDIKTVGQYTGLCDKNGTKIFEGDIFEEVENETRGVVVFENGAFKIRWYGIQTVLKEYGYDDGGWGEIETESFDMYYVDKMEVIGNIHDNPELLEG